MIIKKSGGRWQLSLLASVVISAFFLNTAYAWQQEYIVDTQPGHSTERYTWDSDHQPDYNDILSQRIQSSQRALGLEVNLAEETPVDVTSSMSMGWNFPLYEQVTTGPVAALHYDGTTTSMYNEFGDSTTTLADPLWHASVSTLGWRVTTPGLAIFDPGRKSAITSNLARISGRRNRPEPDDGDKPERQLAGCHRRR